MPLFTAILALGKHDGNMLFGESDITWDELENVTDGYFDGFAKEDCQIITHHADGKEEIINVQ